MKTRALAAIMASSLVLAACASFFGQDTERERLAREAQAERAAREAVREASALYSAIIYFRLGSAELDDTGRRELAWFVGRMQAYPTARFDVQGYTDSTGGDATNAQVARERADAVAIALEGLGIAKERLVVQALGESAPAATNRTAQGRRNNRRVEVTIRVDDAARDATAIVPVNPDENGS